MRAVVGMPGSFDLFFVSSNRSKYREAQSIAARFGIRLGLIQSALEEIQSCSLKEIAEKKALDAFDKFGRPVVVEDDGLFIDGLDGFPGPFSSYVFQTIGNDGILRLLMQQHQRRQNRKAKFVSVIAFCSGDASKSFEAKLFGSIAKTPRGRGWGYDPIFVPENTNRTFAQLSDAKDGMSHRYKALKKFSSWYLNMRESSGR